MPPGLGGYSAIVLAVCVTGAVAYLAQSTSSDAKNFPTINPISGIEIIGKARKDDYARRGYKYFEEGVRKFPGKPFNVWTDFGQVTVLPSQWAHDIRNEPSLHFMKAIHQDFHADYAPFKPFASGTSDDALLQAVARKQLTKYLNKVTKPLSAETKFALDVNFGSPSDWKEFALKDSMLDVIARISSCVFLGDKICRNKEWIDVAKSYTSLAWLAAEELRSYPKWSRGVVNRFLPSCQKLVFLAKKADEIVNPIIDERRALKSQGKYNPSHSDSLDWFEEEAGGRPYDAGLCQLIMSVAAIHTTSDLSNATIVQLATRPELVEELRKEIIQVLSADGWKKTSLFNLKLLDSTLKESQRYQRHWARMERLVIKDFTLPDGSVLRKGNRTVVSTSGMGDPEFYDNPETFDAHRYVRMRDDPERANLSHLVSTGPHHLGFGHGKHACPGRFFASNELKVLLCHFIMKYDFKLPEDYQSQNFPMGARIVIEPKSRVLVKARTPEIDLDNLED